MEVAGRWLNKYNWRYLAVFGTVYYCTTICMFWLVVFGKEDSFFRSSPFVMIIDGDQNLAQGIGYLVVMWACVEMAPPGLEGTTLALTTTIGNAGQGMGGFITTFLNSFFPVTQEEMTCSVHHVAAHAQQTYFHSALVVMVLQCAFLVMLGWLPTSMADSKQRFEAASNSSCVRIVCVVLLIYAMFSTLFLQVIGTLTCPGFILFGGGGGSCTTPPPQSMCPTSTPAPLPKLFGV